MATDQEIIDGSVRIASCIPTGMQNAAIIYLLSQQLTPVPTPAEIMAASACYTCIPAGMQQAAILYLLNSGAGGGGASSGVTCSPSSNPSGVPTGNCGLWVRLDVGQAWVYNSTTGTWNLLLA